MKSCTDKIQVLKYVFENIQDKASNIIKKFVCVL